MKDKILKKSTWKWVLVANIELQLGTWWIILVMISYNHFDKRKILLS